MKKVMVFGTYNILHPGHLNFFSQARRYGDRLYVVLARSDTVEKLKKYTPASEEERSRKLLSLPMVDEVVVGDSEDRMKPIRSVMPDVICLGYDQKYFVDILEKYIADEGLAIEIVRLKAYKPGQYKSSKLV